MFKKVISAAMAVTLCMSGAQLVKNICGADIGFKPITASAFSSYTTQLTAGTPIYTSPTSGVSNSKVTVTTLYTIVDESTSGGYVYGKLKSGAGWVRLKTVPTDDGPQNYTKSFPAGTKLYTAAGSGVVSMTLSSAGTYTIVYHKTVNGVKYGQFKSGAGWAVLSGSDIIVTPPTVDGKLLDVNMSKIAQVGLQKFSGPCAAYSLAYARTILDGYVHYYTEYYVNNSYCEWTLGNYMNDENYSTKQAAYQEAYDRINKGQPVIFRIQGSGNNDHYVTCVGYVKGANRSNLKASDFYVIDPARADSSGKPYIQRLSYNDLRYVKKYKLVVKYR